MWTASLPTTVTPDPTQTRTNQEDASLTDNPGSDFTAVWNSVVSELNGETAGETAADGNSPQQTLVAPLTAQQRA